jgi:predicted flap endonuclease-1-like 5' DNA nuclease
MQYQREVMAKSVAAGIASAAAAASVAEAVAEATPVKLPQKGGQDDLTVIEGIGPKMAGALRTAGIDTFVKLSQTTETALRAAIEAAGLSFAPSLPTWPEQASYVVRGDMDGLKTFQKQLNAGRKD